MSNYWYNGRPNINPSVPNRDFSANEPGFPSGGVASQSTYQIPQPTPTSGSYPSNTTPLSSVDQVLTPLAAEYTKFGSSDSRRNPLFGLIWANEQTKNYIANSFHPYTENADLFSFDSGIWKYTEIRNGKQHITRLFNIIIDAITVLIDSKTHSIVCFSVRYSTGYVTDITVIPYTHYERRQLKEHFRIHQTLSFTPNRNNIINEFLYMLISNSLHSPDCLIRFCHQGWNVTEDNTPVFITSSNYPAYVQSFLNDSIKQRSLCITQEGPENIIADLWLNLPDFFEVKLMLAIRAASLLLFFMQKTGLMPQQVFLFESSDPLTLSIASMLLKTNNDYDTPLPTLADKPDKLKKDFGDIYDGIAITFDHANVSSSQREKGISAIINDVVACNYSANAARHIQVILSESADYYKDSEKLLHLHLERIVPQKNIQTLSNTLSRLDYVIVNKFMEVQNVAMLNSETIFVGNDDKYPHISLERRSTYQLIQQGISLLKILGFDSFDEEFEKKLDTWFMAVDMSGNSQEFDIVNSFSDALDTATADNEIQFSYLSNSKPIVDSPNIIFHDDEYLYLSSNFIDINILPILKGNVTHRQLIRALDAAHMINKSCHYCQQIYIRDEKGNLNVIYRYAIKKEILNQDKLQRINNNKNEEFFLEASELPKNNFLPLLTDKYSGRHIVRQLESGVKANNHILITGESGRGKSFFMMRTAAYLAEMGEKVFILDSNGSDTLDDLIDTIPEDIVNSSIEIIDLENEKFPVDPFSVIDAKRNDSKANLLTDILLSAAYDATDVQADKLKVLILEHLNDICSEGRVSPKKILDLVNDENPSISAIRDKLLPILNHLSDNIDYEQTWESLLEVKQNIIIFSIDAHLEKRGKKLLDILLASFYSYHTRHRDRRVWICIDEIRDQNLSEDGIINRIFTQGRRSRIYLIGATQNYHLSRSDDWETLNNAATKVFFQPHPSSVNDVMKEAEIPQAERNSLSQMPHGECIIKSELYSKTDKRNQPTVVRGIVPKEYTRIKNMLPPAPQYGIPAIDTDP